jgi:uncharacterized protein
MKIANQFSVSAPIEQAWDVLCDLEQVIPLMPGAQLVGHEGDDYLGKVKVKVGPVTSEFTGKVRFVEQDRDQHRAVIDGKGKESVDTDLKIVGKLAQFGSGMLQQVSEKLLGQFVESFEAKLTAESAGSPPSPASPVVPADTEAAAKPVAEARQAPTAEPEPIDLLELAGAGQLKKYGSAAAAALAVLVLIWVLRRRR